VAVVALAGLVVAVDLVAAAPEGVSDG